MMLAAIESFLGSVWFAGLTFVVGYVLGHMYPIKRR